MNKNTVLSLASLVVLTAISVESGHAQHGDMWSNYAQNAGLYTPHINNCDSSTEVFVSVGNGNLGFCMEKSERSADNWDDARETCADAGKRLPEIQEYKIACKLAPSGLTNVTGNWEWATNYSGPLHSYHLSFSGAVATVFGYANCASASWGVVGHEGNSEDSNVFRCVR